MVARINRYRANNLIDRTNLTEKNCHDITLNDDYHYFNDYMKRVKAFDTTFVFLISSNRSLKFF